MKKKINDNQAACDFAAHILHDARLLPVSLLRNYAEMELNEKELIRLLRLVSLCYNGGTASLSQAAAEFGVDETEAEALLRPFQDRRLLEYDPAAGTFGCEGLRRELYLQWIAACDDEADAASDLSSLASPPEREEMRALAHLYRRFEQELCRPLKYSESDRLRCWVEDEKLAPELIEEALKRASLRDKCNMNYIGSILKNWQKKHLTTLAQVLEKDVPEETGPAGSTEKPVRNVDKYAKVKRN